MPVLLLICIVVAVVASILLVPIVRFLAHKLGIVDTPDHGRKLHQRSIALGGGVAVFAAAIIGVAVTTHFDQHAGHTTAADRTQMVPVIRGSIVDADHRLDR